MPTISQIKQQAKQHLINIKGKYALYAIAIILLLTNLLLNVAENVGLLLSLLTTFLLLFFTLSANLIMLTAIRKGHKEVHFSQNQLAFSYPYFRPLIRLFLLEFAILTGLSLISFIGGELIGLSSYLLTIDSHSYYPLMIGILGVIITLLSLLALISFYYGYRMATYITFDALHQNANADNGSIASLKQSLQMMKGHKWQLFLLDLSFIGWYVLTLVTFGLMLIPLIPYKSVSEIVFYQSLIKTKKKA
ncbi:DUF975 family protein [Streptococcus sp. zg-JUN1979]|uniref:DUF975 family protein n=1 Tax=Streptococcus sp. zg-JUN1979 TaxID=3391450 RepID=UPI0039A6DCB2